MERPAKGLFLCRQFGIASLVSPIKHTSGLTLLRDPRTLVLKGPITHKYESVFIRLIRVISVLKSVTVFSITILLIARPVTKFISYFAADVYF
jgi:hypothetical protein